ncbi:hypothetical protein NDU88_003238 [Pleurodeles waltl]|uniref:Uncharacterized protein n=1 Tax=Pleurodeles waltl TaxID=8319 RepID=A0AAV7TNJ0_PLEWA|nr:hypothetical protein NDU88_003238 [Pleurodeles waltl]
MAEESKVQVALALLRQAGRMDLVREEAFAPGRPARRTSAGVAAAVMACLPLRAGHGVQVRGVGRGAGGPESGVAVGQGEGGPGSGRRALGCRGLPLGRGALGLRVGAVERPAASGEARLPVARVGKRRIEAPGAAFKQQQGKASISGLTGLEGPVSKGHGGGHRSWGKRGGGKGCAEKGWTSLRAGG